MLKIAIPILFAIFIILGIKQLKQGKLASGFTLLTLALYGICGTAIFIYYKNMESIVAWVDTSTVTQVFAVVMVALGGLAPLALLISTVCALDKDHKVAPVLLPVVIWLLFMGTTAKMLTGVWMLVSYFALILLSQVIILLGELPESYDVDGEHGANGCPSGGCM